MTKSAPPGKQPICLSFRPNTVVTTGTAWGGASEIITLKSGDRRRRNELADRAKHLKILQNYGLQPPSKSDRAGRDGSGDREGGDYEDDGFEGEVRRRTATGVALLGKIVFLSDGALLN